MSARIEIHPATWRDSWTKVDRPIAAELPPSKRPHFVHLVGANGEIEWHTENLSTRASARKAAKRHAKAYGVPVWEFDAQGERIRTAKMKAGR